MFFVEDGRRLREQVFNIEVQASGLKVRVWIAVADFAVCVGLACRAGLAALVVVVLVVSIVVGVLDIVRVKLGVLKLALVKSAVSG